MQKAGRRVLGSGCPFRLSAINHLHAVRSCFWCLPSCPRTLQPSSAVRAVQERWDVKHVNATASASSHPYVLRSLQGKSTRDPLSSRVKIRKAEESKENDHVLYKKPGMCEPQSLGLQSALKHHTTTSESCKRAGIVWPCLAPACYLSAVAPISSAWPNIFRGYYGTLLALAMVVAKTVMMMRMKMGYAKRQVATENEAQEKYSQDDS